MAENSENLLSLTPVSDADSGVYDPTGQIFTFPSWVFPMCYRGNRLPEHVIARQPVDPLRSSKCISLVTLTPN
jgi:hypothetical protein